ncbi:MAG: hypothetical protein V3U35_04145, partial [Candidatus Neomarinimicrobiota bacterium]
HPNGNRYWAVEAINFPGGPNPEATGFGWFRMPNRKILSTYVNGKFFDKIYFAPKDPTFTLIEPCLDQPGEFSPHFGCNGPSRWPTYALSPASLFSPDVLSLNEQTGVYFTDPWDLPGGHRTPTMG